MLRPVLLLVLLAPRFAAAQDFAADGIRALDAGQPAVAEPLFRKAVEGNPGDYFGHFNLALALSMQNKDVEAASEFRRTLELKPGLYEADLNLGMVLLRDGKAPEALAVLKEAAELNPTLARPNFYYGQALFETGDFPGAELHYGIAAKDPKSAPSAELGLGRSLLRQGKVEDAAQHMRAATALDPRMHDSLLEVAAAYEKAGILPAAIAIYREFPDNPAAKQRVVELQNVLLPHKLTVAELQHAVGADPSNFDARMDLAQRLRDQHEYAAAAQQYFEATKLRPDSLPAWNNLAAVLVINKNFAEAIGALDHAKALGKETPGQLYFRAISLDSLKQHQPAITAYQQFLAADGGKMPDEEFLARQRIRIIESEMKR
jgi:tetratricopeptide (TPR) repeat protein